MNKFLDKLKDGLETVSEYIALGLVYIIFFIFWVAIVLLAIVLIFLGTIGIPAGYITMIVFMFKGMVSPWWLFSVPATPLIMSICLAMGQDFLNEMLEDRPEMFKKKSKNKVS